MYTCCIHNSSWTRGLPERKPTKKDQYYRQPRGLARLFVTEHRADTGKKRHPSAKPTIEELSRPQSERLWDDWWGYTYTAITRGPAFRTNLPRVAMVIFTKIRIANNANAYGWIRGVRLLRTISRAPRGRSSTARCFDFSQSFIGKRSCTGKR